MSVGSERIKINILPSLVHMINIRWGLPVYILIIYFDKNRSNYYTSILPTSIYIHFVNGTDRIIDTYMLLQDPKFMGDQRQQLKIFNRLYIVVLVV